MDECSRCGFFIDNRPRAVPSRCVKHGPNDDISSRGWCKFFREGEPDEFGDKPLSLTTKKESGYVDDARASMKRPGHDWRKREG